MVPRKKVQLESVAKNNLKRNSTRPKRESQNRALYDAASGTWLKTEAQMDLSDSESVIKEPKKATIKKTEAITIPTESSKRRRGRPRKIKSIENKEAVDEIKTPDESQDSGFDSTSFDLSGIQEKMKILDELVLQVNRIILPSESGSSNLAQEEDAIPMGQQVDDYINRMLYGEFAQPVESLLKNVRQFENSSTTT